jgi:hypothetical protein
MMPKLNGSPFRRGVRPLLSDRDHRRDNHFGLIAVSSGTWTNAWKSPTSHPKAAVLLPTMHVACCYSSERRHSESA